MRRVKDHSALQHVATVRVLLSLMVTRWTSGGWSAGRALILRFLVMVMPMIPAGRGSCLIVLRCCLFERQIFARQAACKPFIEFSISLAILYLNDGGRRCTRSRADGREHRLDRRGTIRTRESARVHPAT